MTKADRDYLDAVVRDGKTCPKCKIFKPRADYAKNATQIGGLQGYCRACSCIASREWKEKNRDKKREHKRASYWRNVESNRAKNRQLTPERRAKKNAAQTAYRIANPAKIRMFNRLRHNKVRAGGQLPHPYEISEMLCDQDARCVYCHAVLDDFHVDHKLPVSRGGTNDIENLQLLCPPCNMRKSATTHEEVLSRMGRLF